MDDICVLGMDLAGVPHRPTGMCVLKEMKAKTFLSFSDEEILAYAEHVIFCYLIVVPAPDQVLL